MNIRLVIFSGLVMMVMGTISGIGVSKYSEQRYQCCNIGTAVDRGYSEARAPREYATAGAMIGFLVGSTLEMLRQATPQEAEK